MTRRSLVAAFALAVWAAPAAAQGPTLAGGIEIGGTGVKATVVRIDPSARPNPVTILLSKTTNTAISDFDGGKLRPEAVKETAAAVVAFIAQFEKEFGLPPARTTVVGSSGVALASNTEALVAALKQATGKEIEFITAEREAELVLTGLAMGGERADAMLIDIGGGNTKGGVFVNGRFVPYSISLGVRTYTTRVKAAAAGRPFAVAARVLADAEVRTPLAEQAARRPELTSRQTVYAVGGVIWAVATYAHPEMADQPLVPLTSADIDRFLALLEKADAIPELDVSGVGDEVVRKMALADGKRIRESFAVENLIAGATILKSTFDVFRVDGKKAYFARNGATAWIAAYVVAAAPPAPPLACVPCPCVRVVWVCPAPAPAQRAGPFRLLRRR